MVVLSKSHPHSDDKRWYALHLQPCLFGGVDIVRRWGKVGGGPGRERREHRSTADEAEKRAHELLKQRRRAGFVTT